jgi:hypothetical protein
MLEPCCYVVVKTKGEAKENFGGEIFEVMVMW